MHRWCLLNLTVQGFSLNLTVRGVSNKYCLLTFFIVCSFIEYSIGQKRVTWSNLVSDVVDGIMTFFLSLFQSLRVQMGVPLTEQIIQAFMGRFGK